MGDGPIRGKLISSVYWPSVFVGSNGEVFPSVLLMGLAIETGETPSHSPIPVTDSLNDCGPARSKGGRLTLYSH